MITCWEVFVDNITEPSAIIYDPAMADQIFRNVFAECDEDTEDGFLLIIETKILG